jgi:hypothetical protein
VPNRAPVRQLVERSRCAQRHEGVADILALEKGGSTSPSGRVEARSLLECTPISISPASSAASISLENSPLPPASLSGRSVSRSPLV